MTFFRFLNGQGLVGFAVSICLALLLLLQKGETRHWKAASHKLEQLYRGEQNAFAATVANYRRAAEAARAADRANAERVASEQNAINQRISDDFEARLSAARAAAERLRQQVRTASTDPSSGGAAGMPALSAAAGQSAQAPGEDGLPDRLLATEQAIQLEELIEWVRQQAKVDPQTDPRSR